MEGSRLKVDIETVATREVELTIEPDAEVVSRAARRAAREISRVRPVAGFRPGKAPYRMVERVYGRELILDQALNDIAQRVYREAVEQAGVEPFQQGQLDVVTHDPLVLKVRVPLVPSVTLGDYTTPEVEPEPEVALTEEQIDEQLQAVRSRHAEHAPVERAAKLGDEVVAAITGTVGGEQMVNEENATLTLQDDMTPPGFGEALLGMSAAESREFSLTYPEDYDEERLAGKNVDFRVTVTAVREIELPALDDDLAKAAGDYETLDELRRSLAEQLEARLAAQAREREAMAAIEALVAQSQMEYPAAALDAEIEQMIASQRSRLQQVGFEWEAYLRMTGQTETQLRERVHADAVRRLEQRLALMEFAKAEGISLSDEETADQLRGVVGKLSAAYDQPPATVMERLNQSGALPSIYFDALTGKAVRHLTAMLTGRPVDDETEGKQAGDAGAEIEPEPEAKTDAVGGEETSSLE